MQSNGTALNPGIFQLAAISDALYKNIFCKGKGFLWIPVPMNIRRKGEYDSLLGNGLSFLFYKLNKEDFETHDKTIMSLRKQMLNQVGSKMPEAFYDFSEAYRFMPFFFYYPMLNLPSLGKLASFNFSTLGEVFSGLDEFLGKKVLSISNYPSNAISPGFTFLFYNYRGTLRMVSSWVHGQYTKEEQLRIINDIKSFMTG